MYMTLQYAALSLNRAANLQALAGIDLDQMTSAQSATYPTNHLLGYELSHAKSHLNAWEGLQIIGSV